MEDHATVLTRASKEWFRRPADERHLSLSDLYRATLERSYISRSDVVSNATLFADGEARAEGSLWLHHRDLGTLSLMDWSLGQLATIARVPARFFREIAAVPSGPILAANALNLGLRYLAERGETQILTLDHGEEEPQELRALVGRDYGRIFDHEVVATVIRVNHDERW